MSLIKEIIQKYKFNIGADRIGPDIPFTYWNLFFKSRMIKICKKKFLNFGTNSDVRPGVYVVGCSKIKMGNNVVLRPGTMIHADTATLDVSLIIEDDVLIGSGVHIYVENHNFSNPNEIISLQGHSEAQIVILRKGCWIGANAIILPGVEVGENCVIGAGSVVTKSIPSHSVAVGNPAKVIKKII